MNVLDLVSLISSRLCHDLASPIGAAANGAELLAEDDDPAMRDQAIALIGDSTQDAARRLAYFRLAFGSASGMGETVAVAEVRARAVDYFGLARRIQLDWAAPPADAVAPKHQARLVMLLLLLAQTALPRGGTLRVDAACRAVTAEAERVEPSAAVLAALRGGEPAADGLGALCALAALLAAAAGGKLAAQHGPGRLELALL